MASSFFKSPHPEMSSNLGWLKYFNQKYRCPVCEARVSSFDPAGWDFAVLADRAVIGGGRREHVVCPNCGCGDRIRLVFLFLKNNPALLSGIRSLLHIAPEYHIRVWLDALPEIEYVTADLEKSDVDLKLDLTSIDLPDARFDGIICCHVLEHVVDDRKAMSELFRVLKPGGWAILQVPISANSPTYEDESIVEPADQERAFGQAGHVRIYGMDYVDRLHDAGFSVEIFRWKTQPADFGGEENTYGLIENEPLFLVRRPF